MCDATLAVIGPQWNPERAGDTDDWVRTELVMAHDLGRRIIPVLHSSAEIPSPDMLSSDLAWLPGLDAVRFHGAATFSHDVKTLLTTLLGDEEATLGRAARAADLYGTSNHSDLADFVETLWNEDASRPTPGHAEAYRRMSLVALRRGDRLAQSVWLARAQSAAYKSGASNTAAACLLPLFFGLISAKAWHPAEAVIAEIDRLIDPQDSRQGLAFGEVRRMVAEKRAYLHYAQGNYESARRLYELARAASAEDERGEAKCRGAIYLCDFHLGDTEMALTGLGDLIDASAAKGWLDVSRTAAHNLAVVNGGAGQLQPFELT